MKRAFVFVIVGLCLCLTGCQTMKDFFSGRSSDIPERREFPVNTSIDPCDDYYEYACSEVVDSFRLPENRSYHAFSFSDANERLLIAKGKYLSELSQKTSLSPRVAALKTVFNACMNGDARKSEEMQLVKQSIVSVNAQKSRKTLVAYFAQKITSPDASFIGFGSLPNHDRPDWNDVLFISSMKTLPERSYYENKVVMADFLALATKFYQTVGLDRPLLRAKWLVDFEKGFAKTYPTPVEIRDLVNKKTRISRDKLMYQYPNLGLKNILNQIPRRTKFRNITPANFKYVNDALGTFSLDALKSIYLFHDLANFMDDAYPEYFQARFAFSQKHMGGPAKRGNRLERCTKMVKYNFSKELDAELIDDFFPNFPSNKVTLLSEKIRNSIIRGIKTNAWLSRKGKIGAIRKIKGADLMLVKPQSDEEWKFNPPAKYLFDQPIANSKILQKNLLRRELAELSKKRFKNEWLISPLSINAYYYPPNNQFVLPIGILQYPFFDPDLPLEVNLGAIGSVIGHELGHGIDDKGSRYDYRGRLSRWMPIKDIEQFKKKSHALVGQFNKIGHNGELTLGENIGDLVGLTFAYQAAFPNGAGPLEAKQSFFLQNARLWCSVMRPKFKERLLKTDPHSLSKARVNEQVKHQAGFAEAYSCKAGSRMVLPSQERIKIW